MYVLTIDVGIKNLGIIIMSGNKSVFNIHFWDNINTIEHIPNKCRFILKNGNVCNKKCTYKCGKDVSCKRHSKELKFPQKINTNMSKLTLQVIVKKVINCINDLIHSNKELINCVDKVLIELQPRINQKMKLISHVLFGKFVEYFNNINKNTTLVRFVSASKKLKVSYKGPSIESKLKSKYSIRKYKSVEYTRWYLKEKFNEEQRIKWLYILEEHKKKSDLADAFLMAINELEKIEK